MTDCTHPGDRIAVEIEVAHALESGVETDPDLRLLVISGRCACGMRLRFRGVAAGTPSATEPRVSAGDDVVIMPVVLDTGVS